MHYFLRTFCTIVSLVPSLSTFERVTIRMGGGERARKERAPKMFSRKLIYALQDGSGARGMRFFARLMRLQSRVQTI